MYLVLTAILALNVSKEILNAFVVVNEGLRTTNTNIEEGNSSLYTDFQFAYDQNPIKVGENWEKAQKIRTEADALMAHITQLQAYLISETEGLPLDQVLRDSTYTDANGNQVTVQVLMDLGSVQMKDDMNVPTSILVGSEPAKPNDSEWSATRLKQLIHAYRDLLISCVDPSSAVLYAEPVKHLLTMPDVVMNHGEESNWEAGIFYDTPLAASITILSKIKADIRQTEAEIVQYLYQEFDDEIIKVNHLEAAVIPVSSYLLQGDTFRARVFVAASDTNKQPEMFLGQGFDFSTFEFANGSSQLDVNGGMGYINIPTNEIGEHTWEGYINYRTDDGRILQYPYSTTYKVATPTASVSPTNMNVFYRGVDNPVSITAGGVDQDKISVSVDNGTIVRDGNGWAVRVNSGSSCTVSVTAETPDGGRQSMGSMTFRVKSLPPPVFYFAGYNYKDNTISLSDAKNGTAVGVRPEEDLFNAQWTIISYEFYMDGVSIKGTGQSLNSDIRSVLSRVRSGQYISFSSVRAKSPAGEIVSINGINLRVQ